MSNLKIICDSLADIPEYFIKKYDVEVVPLTISIDGIEYKQGVDLSVDEFYKKIRMTSSIPKTSQATYTQFKEVFEKYIDEGKSILYISASSKATGTCQSALMAKNDLDGDIHIFDSYNLSFGCGCQVLTACEMREDGYSIEEIIEKLEFVRDNVVVVFAVDSLDYLRKGGRLSSSKAIIGHMLSMKPIVIVEDGLVRNIDTVRGKKKEIVRMIEIAKESTNGNIEDKRIAIGNGDNLEDMKKLEEIIINEYPMEKILKIDIGAGIGSHAGPGTIGICIWDDKCDKM